MILAFFRRADARENPHGLVNCILIPFPGWYWERVRRSDPPAFFVQTGWGRICPTRSRWNSFIFHARRCGTGNRGHERVRGGDAHT